MGLAFAFVVLGFTIGAVFLSAYIRRRNHAIIHDWARENGFVVESIRAANFWQHPDFFSPVASYRAAFRVVATDSEGRRRRGAITVGTVNFMPNRQMVFAYWDQMSPASLGFPVIMRPPPD